MDEKTNKNNYTMVEMIHKCLRCNKMAYETDDYVFKCSDDKCAFEWEVVECGKRLL